MIASPLRRLVGSGMASLVVLANPVGSSAQEADVDFVGTWEGKLDAGAAQLRLVLHVSRGDDGALSATLDSPDQGSNGIPVTTVEATDGTLVFTVQALGVRYEGEVDADGAVAGTFNQGPAQLPLTLRRVERPSEPERPQHPNPPFPYAAEDVRVPTDDPDVVLAGTLTLPEGPGPFPAAVLVSGSGPQDRDETLMGHKPFLVLSDHLTRAGIAVLRYDDRGIGRSTGRFAEATTEDFAADAVAAVEYLAARHDIGPVGIVGHSEGGLVGPLAATRSDRVAFVVMLAGPGITGAEILDLQAAMINRAGGASEEMIRDNGALQHRLFGILRDQPDASKAEPLLRAELERAADASPDPGAARQRVGAEVAQLNSPWFRFFLDYDPRPTLSRVRVPVLALNGEKDLQVPPRANLPEVRGALEAGGNPDVTTRELPGLNHLFQSAGTGSPSEYASITETMSPAALDAVRDWILERFGTAR